MELILGSWSRFWILKERGPDIHVLELGNGDNQSKAIVYNNRVQIISISIYSTVIHD